MEETYIETEKIPEDRGFERINNRFAQILGEISSLKTSLRINENKIRDLMLKEHKKGNEVYVNGRRVEVNPKSSVLACYDDKNVRYYTEYSSIHNVVITRKE